MKILSLGLDKSILDKKSLLAARAIEYGRLVERYDVIVPADKNQEVMLSGNVIVYGVGGINKIVKLFNCYKLANQLIKEKKFDVITVQDQYYLAFISWRLAKKFKISLEVQVHGFEKFYGVRQIIARHTLSRAQAVRVVSQRLKRELTDNFKVDENKITVVPIYSEVGNMKQELGIRNQEVKTKARSNKFIFLTVGRLVEVKNIGLQIEAMAEVVKKYPNTELWIIGDGPERKNYELRIKNYELADKIKIFGWQMNLEEFYGQADAYLLTSDYEGWGLSVIEAASFKLPIVMTDVGSAGEVIKNEESGLIINIGDKIALVKAMIKMIENNEMRQRLSEMAILAIKNLPTKEQTFKLYLESWRKAVEGK